MFWVPVAVELRVRRCFLFLVFRYNLSLRRSLSPTLPFSRPRSAQASCAATRHNTRIGAFFRCGGTCIRRRFLLFVASELVSDVAFSPTVIGAGKLRRYIYS